MFPQLLTVLTLIAHLPAAPIVDPAARPATRLAQYYDQAPFPTRGLVVTRTTRGYTVSGIPVAGLIAIPDGGGACPHVYSRALGHTALWFVNVTVWDPKTRTWSAPLRTAVLDCVRGRDMAGHRAKVRAVPGLGAVGNLVAEFDARFAARYHFAVHQVGSGSTGVRIGPLYRISGPGLGLLHP